ncbi:MAG: hypothetical protein ACOZCO_10520 [Bacteroidota bacterium]
MYKITKYKDIIPSYGQSAIKRYEIIRQISKNFTVSHKTALEMDRLFTEQLEEKIKEELKEKGNTKNGSPESLAREVAKMLIEDDVIAGRTISEIKASHAGFSDGQNEVGISKGKIHVRRVKGKKVNFSFPVQSIYNEIMDEAGKNYSYPSPTNKTPSQKPQPKTKSFRQKISYENAKPVERIEEEVRFIKRYVSMHGRNMSIKQVLNLLNGLQRAILERRIRKTSSYAKEVKYMQEKLIGLYNYMRKNHKQEMEIELDKKILKEFSEIAGSEMVRSSTNYLKRYVGIQGKEIDKEKAERLIKTLENAAKRSKISKDDPYVDQLNKIYDSLYRFVNKAKKGDRLELHENALNGLESFLGCVDMADCGCEGEEKSLRGLDDVPEKPSRNLMNSVDFANMEFETLGFMGKWLDLIGDPSEGFTAMVFGRPKMGKSFLCIDFAGYLSRHHGRTLYVAKEEKLDKTLQDKLNEKGVKHPMLDVSDHLPNDLSDYDFIFLDSVNTLGLSPEDLRQLKQENPGKSFIYIFQTTKEGNFRGANSFQHDVDVVIEIPEKGKAVQFGRFNQGGEMEIFGKEN